MYLTKVHSMINRIDGQWSSWLTWSNCSTSVCGNVGVRTRMRDCNNPPKSAQFGKDCVGDKLQTINCTTPCKEQQHN
ncbi:hypothetical protein KUTeg_001373 [Tegillarca granosa]|uniref:Uncharacterized protein n=1 Tax=Tegillarca granosa TaxID=220873 RepID=A0ABQ9FSR7_TEGGR|nr:hypothetical protein KUTeg_001373 [Tegillarca granosa]